MPSSKKSSEGLSPNAKRKGDVLVSSDIKPRRRKKNNNGNKKKRPRMTAQDYADDIQLNFIEEGISASKNTSKKIPIAKEARGAQKDIIVTPQNDIISSTSAKNAATKTTTAKTSASNNTNGLGIVGSVAKSSSLAGKSKDTKNLGIVGRSVAVGRTTTTTTTTTTTDQASVFDFVDEAAPEPTKREAAISRALESKRQERDPEDDVDLIEMEKLEGSDGLAANEGSDDLATNEAEFLNDYHKRWHQQNDAIMDGIDGMEDKDWPFGRPLFVQGGYRALKDLLSGKVFPSNLTDSSALQKKPNLLRLHKYIMSHPDVLAMRNAGSSKNLHYLFSRCYLSNCLLLVEKCDRRFVDVCLSLIDYDKDHLDANIGDVIEAVAEKLKLKSLDQLWKDLEGDVSQELVPLEPGIRRDRKKLNIGYFRYIPKNKNNPKLGKGRYERAIWEYNATTITGQRARMSLTRGMIPRPTMPPQPGEIRGYRMFDLSRVPHLDETEAACIPAPLVNLFCMFCEALMMMSCFPKGLRQNKYCDVSGIPEDDKFAVHLEMYFKLMDGEPNPDEKFLHQWAREQRFSFLNGELSFFRDNLLTEKDFLPKFSVIRFEIELKQAIDEYEKKVSSIASTLVENDCHFGNARDDDGDSSSLRNMIHNNNKTGSTWALRGHLFPLLMACVTPDPTDNIPRCPSIETRRGGGKIRDEVRSCLYLRVYSDYQERLDYMVEQLHLQFLPFMREKILEEQVTIHHGSRNSIRVDTGLDVVEEKLEELKTLLEQRVTQQLILPPGYKASQSIKRPVPLTRTRILEIVNSKIKQTEMFEQIKKHLHEEFLSCPPLNIPVPHGICKCGFMMNILLKKYRACGLDSEAYKDLQGTNPKKKGRKTFYTYE